MFCESDKQKYMQILAELNGNHAKIFTQLELSKHLKVSVRKLSDFKSGKIIDFELLTQYAGIIGRNVIFTLI